ncbi:radical SAM protein, partial [bacterium]|nr:radical SAM protein [bacterium]
MKILKVPKGSSGWKAGLRDNDNIITINDIQINDQIDYKYHISDDIINMVIERDGSEFEIQIEKEPDDDLG